MDPSAASTSESDEEAALVPQAEESRCHPGDVTYSCIATAICLVGYAVIIVVLAYLQPPKAHQKFG